jgi:hypothetical protein
MRPALTLTGRSTGRRRFTRVRPFRVAVFAVHADDLLARDLHVVSNGRGLFIYDPCVRVGLAAFGTAASSSRLDACHGLTCNGTRDLPSRATWAGSRCMSSARAGPSGLRRELGCRSVLDRRLHTHRRCLDRWWRARAHLGIPTFVFGDRSTLPRVPCCYHVLNLRGLGEAPVQGFPVPSIRLNPAGTSPNCLA